MDAALANVAPELLKASRQAAADHANGLVQKAIDGLTKARSARRSEMSHVRAAMDADAQSLRQIAGYKIDAGEYLSAADDLEEAIELTSGKETEILKHIRSTQGFAIASELRCLGRYDLARPVFETARGKLFAATVLTWTVLLNLAPDYPTGRIVLAEMIAADVPPDAVTYSTLLNLAPEYPTGRIVLAEMIAADVTPNAVTAVIFAKLVCTIDQADELADEMLTRGVTDPYFFNTVISRIFSLVSGEALLGWAYGKAKTFKFPFPFSAFEPAIVGYRKAQRFDDALRIILPFPQLPASLAYFANPGRAKHAKAYFRAKYEEGFEMHNASYALAKLYWCQKDIPNMLEWAEIALPYPEQPDKRRVDLRAMMAAHNVA